MALPACLIKKRELKALYRMFAVRPNKEAGYRITHTQKENNVYCI